MPRLKASPELGSEYLPLLDLNATETPTNASVRLPASTETPDIAINLARTNTWATSLPSTQRAFYIQAPTYACSAVSTLTTAATLAISGAPVAGTNASITNRYALHVESGLSQLAALRIAAGTTSVAPFKLTSGTNLTAAEAGALEYNGTSLFFTPVSTRKTVSLAEDGASNLRETGGPTTLAIGAVADGQTLSRSGSTVIGVYDWCRMFMAPGRKRWRSVVNRNASNSRLATGSSNAAFAGSPGAAADEAEGCFLPLVTGASSGNTSGGFPVTNGDATAASVAAQMRWTPAFVHRFKTSSDLSSIRLMIGCANGAVSASDSPTSPCICLRYSTGASDTGWVVYSYDGSTGSATSQVASIAADTAYWLVIDVSSTSSVRVWLGTTLANLALVSTKATNLPASTSFQNSTINVTTLTNATRTLKFQLSEGACD